MKLQVALDLFDLEAAIQVAMELKGVADIIEIGTPFIIKEGVRSVTSIKNIVPETLVLADLKIMDAGKHEAGLAFEAGADIVTVLGAADNSTIEGVVKAAGDFGRQVMVDMISVPDIKKRADEIDKLGVDYICVHTATDVQHTGRNLLEELITLNEAVKYAKKAVAGGVKLETLKLIVPHRPEIVVVGGAITGKPDKRKAALEMKELMS